jgi:hypothetical protein
MTFAPRVEGVMPVQSSAEAFIPAFRRRVAAGLLTGRPQPRSNYEAFDEGFGRLRVRAVDYWTAINVGLNDLELEHANGTVRFRVRYWRWASYALGLSGGLGLVGLTLLMTMDVRAYIARESSARLPGISLDQNLALAWIMVLFWGGAWPWLLIAFHKRPLRRLVERIIGEVDAEAAGPILMRGQRD